MAGGLRERLEALDELLRSRGQVHRLGLEPELTRIEPGQVEQVGGEPREPVDLTARRLEEIASRPLVEILVREQLEEPAEREQRRSQLVRRVGNELAPCVVEVREAQAHPVERPRQLGHLVRTSCVDRHLEVSAGDAVGRDLEAPDPPGEPQRGQRPDQPRHDQRDASEDEDVPANDRHRGQARREGLRHEHRRRGAQLGPLRHDGRPGNLGELLPSTADDRLLHGPAGGRSERDGIVGHILGPARPRVRDDVQRIPELLVDHDPCVQLLAEGLGQILVGRPVRHAGRSDDAGRKCRRLGQILEGSVDEPGLERRDDGDVHDRHRTRHRDEEDEAELHAQALQPRNGVIVHSTIYRSRKRYPTPRTVKMYSGSRGSVSIFSRRCLMWTSIVRGSRKSELPQRASSSAARE